MHALRTLAALLVLAPALVAQQTANDEKTICSLMRTNPEQGTQGVGLSAPLTMNFSLPIDGASLSPASVSISSGGIDINTSFNLSLSRKVAWVNFPDFMPAESQIDVVIDGDVLKDSFGKPVDCDNDGQTGGSRAFSFMTGVGAPMETGPATVVGKVVDANGNPFQGAEIDAVFYPSKDGDPPLNSPAISGADGKYTYQTVEFTGSVQFIIRVRFQGNTYSETLKHVKLLANQCFQMKVAKLIPLSPKEPVGQGEEKTLEDPTGQIELYFPPGATQQASNVGITVLPAAEILRDDLPQLVASAGVFTDVAGVFGDEVDVPVRMRLPNTYDLPEGTRIPLGKIDHNTLEWIDLRDAWDGPGDPPDNFQGTVVDDGQGGTVIEIYFDHFCSVCTGYCLPIPCDEPIPSGPPCDPPPSPDPPDPWPWPPYPWCCGNSIVTLSEGFLYEWIDLPGFTERGEEWALQLGYASHAADPSVSLRLGVDFLGTRPVERTIFRFQVEGIEMEAAYGYTDNDRKPRAVWFWDGVDVLGQQLPTGSYAYTAQATSLNAKTKVALPDVFGSAATLEFSNLEYPGLQPLRTSLVDDRAVILNLIDSPYGAGWSVTDDARLHFDADGCIVHVYGNVGWRRYVPDPADAQHWLPADDGADLFRSPSTGEFTRELLDGSVELYDTNGFLQTITDRAGHVTTFGRDGMDRLTSLTSPTGFQYTLSYDGAGKLDQISDSHGRTTDFSVVGGQLTSATDAAGSQRTFTYDSEHRMTSQTGPRGERSEYDYQNGRVVEARAYDVGGGPLLRRRTFSPSALDGEMADAIAAGLGSLLYPIPVTEGHTDLSTDGRGFVSVHETDAQMQTIRQVDQLDREILVSYDSEGNITSRVKPDGARTDATYDAAGNHLSMSEYTAGGTLHSTVALEWNGPFNQLSRSVDEMGKETLYTYDASGNLTTVTDDDGGILAFNYGDPSFPDLPTQVQLPNGDVTDITYGVNGNVATETIHPDGNPLVTQYTYDTAGNLVSKVVPDSGNQQYFYDAMNRVVATRDPNNVLVQYSYTDGGCSCSIDGVTQVTLPGGATLSYEYDGLGRLTQATDQHGASRSFGYDAEGNLVQETRRDGATIDYTYDDAGRMRRKEPSSGQIALYEYDVLDRLTAAEDAVCELEFTYDLLGGVTRAKTRLEVLLGNALVPLEHTVDYTYDVAGNRLTMTDSAGLADYAYQYDDLHRLTNIDLVSDPLLDWTLGHDAAGQRTSLVPSANNAATSWVYDGAGRVSEITHATLPGLGRQYDQYDGAGAILNVTGTLLGGPLDRSALYDLGHRLVQGGLSALFGDTRVPVSYTYDVANRLTSDDEYSYSYDAEGRLITRAPIGGDLTEHYSYDAEGNLLELRQEWDDGGNPVTVMTATYCYDPLGRRVMKDVNGVVTRLVYDGPNLLHEIDRLDRVARSYTYGPGHDDLLAVHDEASGQVYDVLVDRLGSVVGLADVAGNVVQQYVYDEFGNVMNELDPSLHQPVGYTGRLRDMESGLYDYRARIYDSSTGRFLSEDPLRLEGGLNFYTYVENDPLNRIDPTGLLSCAPPRCVVIQEIVCQQRRRQAGANRSVSGGVVATWQGPPLVLAPPPPLPVPGNFVPVVLVGRASQPAQIASNNMSCRIATRVLCFR